MSSAPSIVVEEDPCSQFVDFTNATAFERFISEIEQNLISWQLADRGHAPGCFLEHRGNDVMAASVSSASPKNKKTSHLPLKRPRKITKIIELEDDSSSISVAASSTAGSSLPHSRFYALTLFLPPPTSLQSPSTTFSSTSSSNAQHPASSSSNVSTSQAKKKWQQGCEHFTPSMLCIADSTRDFEWNVGKIGSPSPSGSSAASGSGSIWQNFQDLQKWFGVNEFLLLSRTSQRPKSKPSTPNHSHAPANASSVKANANSPINGSSSDVTTRLQDRIQRKLSIDSVSSEGGPMSPLSSPFSDLLHDPLLQDEEETAAATNAFDVGMEPNEANRLLSALMIALGNCNCTLPAFVPVHDSSRGAFLGCAVPGMTGNVSISFETDFVPEMQLSPNQSCISGLLDFFKLKLALPAQVEAKCSRVDTTSISKDLVTGLWVSASFGYEWKPSFATPGARGDSAPCSSGGGSNGKSASTIGVAPSTCGTGELWREFLLNQDDRVHAMMSLLFHLDSKHDTTANERRRLVWGCSESPLRGIELNATWPNLREGAYVDNVVHSTLNPMTAPEWLLDVQFTRFGNETEQLKQKPTLVLSRMVANLVNAYAKAREVRHDVLVSELAPNLSSGVGSNSGSSYAESSIPAARAAVALGNAIGSLTSSLVSAATWKGSDVVEIQNHISRLFDPVLHETTPWLSMESELNHTVPIGQLVSIVSCQMAKLHGVNAMSLLWVEFVKALRDQWEQQRFLPFMGTGIDGQEPPSSDLSLAANDANSLEFPFPSFHQSLLHQKLRLLNCCIQRQGMRSPSHSPSRRRSRPQASATSVLDETGGSLSDDEFFDTIQDIDDDTAAPEQVESIGAMEPLVGLIGLKSKRQLMRPQTQVAVPLTEDIAKQQEEILSKLGESAESTRLRQQIQSSTLFSDMAAFKAANPGACLADFIRWYSPKDWISHEKSAFIQAELPSEFKDDWWFEDQGMLSERMRCRSGSGSTSSKESSSPRRSSTRSESNNSTNLWHQMWQKAPSLPVDAQKKLFNAHEEAEKLFHYFETMAPHEMFHQMLVGVISCGFFALSRVLQDRFMTRLSVCHKELQQLACCCQRAVGFLDDAYETSSAMAYFATTGDAQRDKEKLQVAFEMALDACWKLVMQMERVETLFCQAACLVQLLVVDDHSSLLQEETEADRARILDEPALANALELIDCILQKQVASNTNAGAGYGALGYTMPMSGPTSVSVVIPRVTNVEKARMASILGHPFLRKQIGALLHLETNRSANGEDGAESSASSTSSGGAGGEEAACTRREYVLRCICPRTFLMDDEEEEEEEEEGEEELDQVNGARKGRDGTNASRNAEDGAPEEESEESPLVVNRMYAAFEKNTVRFALTLAESEF